MGARFPYGSPVGKPNDRQQQMDVLSEALDMLEKSTNPGTIVDSKIRFK